MSADEINEVELSTQDLANLSQSKTAARSQRPQPTVARRSLPVYYLVAAVATICIGLGVVIAMQSEDSSGVPNLPQWRPLPDRDSQILEADEEVPTTDTRAPVRIRNEFDRNEVFEFPPGTSRQEARDQVAKILLQRAIERQSR